MADFRNSKVMRSASESSVCSLGLQRSPKQKCHGSATLVTVTNGEIASVISKHDSLSDGASTLERLRSFTASEPDYPPYLSTASFDGVIFSGEDEGLSLNSNASLDINSYSDWVKTDIVLDEPIENTSIVFTTSANQEAISGDYKGYYQKPFASINPYVDFTRLLKGAKQEHIGSSDPFNGLKTTYYNMEGKDLNVDLTWKAQRQAFWSVKQELASTVDFDRILPELLKFRFFTEDQLRLYNHFQASELSHASKGINAGKILHAVSERVDAERSAIPMFLLTLRKHQPNVADMLQQRIFSIKSRRDFQQMDSRKSRKTYQDSSKETFQNLDTDLLFAGSRNQVKSSVFNTRPEITSKFPPITSRYSRRPITINSSGDYEHMEQIRIKHNIGEKSSSPYFSKSSISSNITSKIEPFPNKYSSAKTQTTDKTATPKPGSPTKRKYVKFQEKVLGKGSGYKRPVDNHVVKKKSPKKNKDARLSQPKSTSTSHAKPDDVINVLPLDDASKPTTNDCILKEEEYSTDAKQVDDTVSEQAVIDFKSDDELATNNTLPNKTVANDEIQKDGDVSIENEVVSNHENVTESAFKSDKEFKHPNNTVQLTAKTLIAIEEGLVPLCENQVIPTETAVQSETVTSIATQEPALPIIHNVTSNARTESETVTTVEKQPPDISLSKMSYKLIEPETVAADIKQSLPLQTKAGVPSLPNANATTPLKHKLTRPSTSNKSCKSTLYITPSSNISPETVFVKRASSCRLDNASRPTVKKTTHSDVIKGVPVNLELSGMERESRPRSHSLTMSPKQPEIKIENDNTKSEDTLKERLLLLRTKFSKIVSAKLYDPDVINFDMTSLTPQIDDLVSELTKECVISTRSAWMVRKVTAPSAKVAGLFDILIGLNDHDANDVIKRCPITTEMLVKACSESEKAAEKKKIAEKTKENLQKLPSKTSSLSTILISPTTNKSKFPIVAGSKKINNKSPDTEILSEEHFSAIKDNSIVQLTENEVLRCEVKIKENENFNDLQIAVDKLQVDIDKPVTKNDDKIFPNVGLDICNICQKPNSLPLGQVNERIAEKGESERIAPVTSSQIAADLVQVKPIEVTTTDTEASICSDTESAVSASSDTDSFTSLGSSRRQYSRLSLNNKRSSARQRRSSGKQQGNYISKVLFPISTRKNLLRKANSLEGATSTEPSKEVTSKEKNPDQEPKDIVKDKVNKMPPVLPLTTTKQAVNCLNEELLIEQTVSRSDLFQLKSSCDKELPIDDVIINDENNNDVIGITPEMKSTCLSTILTNGSRSPPSSFKKKSNRVSFSDLPPIEINLESAKSSDDVTNSDQKMSSTPKKKNEDLPKIDLTKIDGTPANFQREDTPVPNDIPPPKSSQKSRRHDSRPKESSPSNEIDEINELLMDILEEIEAENISLDQCLDDLVVENLLSEELAKTVSSTYVEYKNKFVFFEGSFLAESPRDEQMSEEERERAVEKLLDVLTNLGLEPLRKCRNCILGRLCQLSTYKDFESAQKAAAAANGSSFDDEDTLSSNKINDDSKDLLCKEPAKKSSDCGEASATESEGDDVYVLRHQIQYYDVTNTSLTIKEDKEEDRELKEIAKTKPQTPTSPNKIPKVSSLVPILIDEEIIEAKTAWIILGSGSEVNQRKKLRETLKNVEQNKLNTIYGTPGLEGLQDLLNSDNSDLEIRPRPRSAPCLERATSLPTFELHGASLRKTETSTVVPGGRITRRMSERHPEGSGRLFYRASGGAMGLNDTENKNQENNLTQESSLDTWCRCHNLPDQSSSVLKKNGYRDPAHLYDITEDGIERLVGLTWLEKAKIWLAVENSRLTENLKQSNHQGITDIFKII